ncbi:MAG: noncanonical pyrimidine nucleotidase, YjjG family [Lachnospiraceae bacterium]|nr:noncanonical pyrimidine nucleotidase, YjjG family [Lachnospiraceae bacterium]
MGCNYSVILWDVDDTLLDFPYSQRYALTKCFQTAGLEITEEQIQRYKQINDDYWKRLELGEVTKKELLTGRFCVLFSEYGIESIDVEAFRQEYQEALGSVFRFHDDALTICKSLQGKIGQYVITNGVSSTQRSKLKLSGIMDVMDGIFISEEMGCHKPQKEFFDSCLEQIGARERSKVLIVGDSLSSDIKGGIQSGIPTCWYHSKEKENNTLWKPDYEICDLHMIYDILGGF